MYKFGTKNALFGFFCIGILTLVIFEISTLQFVKNEFLIDTLNFGLGGLPFLKVQVLLRVRFKKSTPI